MWRSLNAWASSFLKLVFVNGGMNNVVFKLLIRSSLEENWGRGVDKTTINLIS